MHGPSINSAPGADVNTLVVRRAEISDLQRIVRIENVSFPTPWSERSLREELLRPRAGYLVAQRGKAVVGYGGMWLCLDEAHIGTLAVDPSSRRCGIGEAVMFGLLRHALDRGARRVILEYRAGNEPAAGLYGKLGFMPNRLRPGYYADTGEDAVEALLGDLASPERQQHLRSLEYRWEQRYGAITFDWHEPHTGD